MLEDVELCLEVQVDPDSKKILSNPERCRSTLLDVTVVKPKELEAFGTQITNTLTAAEVRKLIASLEKQRRKKQKVLDKLKCDDTIVKVRKHEDIHDSYSSPRRVIPRRREKISSAYPLDDLERKDFIGITESVEPLFCEIRRSLKNVETRITNMQDINLMISETTVDECASQEFLTTRKRKHYTPFNNCNQTVYRAEKSPRDLRSILVHENKSRYSRHCDNIEGKCLCEHCGTVGLLVECQKRPLLSDAYLSPSPSIQRKDIKKKAKFQMSDLSNSKLDDSYVSHLSDRLKYLEDRLAMQEEKSIPKDYFKRIMSKVTSFSPSKKLKLKHSDESVCHSEKQRRRKPAKNGTSDQPFRTNSKATVKSSKSNYAAPKEQKNDTNSNNKSDKSTFTEESLIYNGYVWKWGEEILKPGIDLKNRIVALVTDVLCKFPLREKNSNRNFIDPGKRDEIASSTLKHLMEQINTRSFVPPVEPQPTFMMQETCRPNYGNNLNFDIYCKPTLVENKNERKEFINLYERGKSSGNQHKNENIKKVNVSYVNPKLTYSRKDSRGDIKDQPNVKECKQINKGKQEFLKIATKAKPYQKDILWRNIWTQAKANGQTKEDAITIKIPVSSKNKSRNEILATDLTIGEVEAILKGRYELR